jgi:hypothetical protein
MLSLVGAAFVSGKAKIIYSGFYDVPLAFAVWHSGRQFLFLRDFDDVIEDYPDTYRVFSLPGLPDAVIKDSWQRIEGLATGFLGEVPVREVKFDESMRKEIDTDVLDRVAGLS